MAFDCAVSASSPCEHCLFDVTNNLPYHDHVYLAVQYPAHFVVF